MGLDDSYCTVVLLKLKARLISNLSMASGDGVNQVAIDIHFNQKSSIHCAFYPFSCIIFPMHR